MKQRTEQILVFGILVTACVGLRFYFQTIPNFAPVAAVALFAGYFFQSRWLAVLTPVTAMAISDQFTGAYQPILMATVYTCLAVPALLGAPLRQKLNHRGPIASSLTLFSCSLASSLLFFTATNLATWLVTPWYPRTIAGLTQCLVNAVPFFRYTLMGDLFFAAALFGSYAVIRQLATSSQPPLASNRLAAQKG
ncbi:MAG: hypothetical protein GY768_23040 [Planctomycetaceae bacterium]|nr:hypothetical protein [Planctomycetaceae bacterium]